MKLTMAPRIGHDTGFCRDEVGQCWYVIGQPFIRLLRD
jgi:hypothetical protein